MATIKYDTQACGRCAGTGHYSYNASHGTTCYGCSGAGKVLTKQARAAREALKQYVNENATVPVIEVQAGQRVKYQPGTGMRWFTVDAVAVVPGSQVAGSGDDARRASSMLQLQLVAGERRIAATFPLWDEGPHARVQVGMEGAVLDGYLQLAGQLQGVRVEG